MNKEKNEMLLIVPYLIGVIVVICITLLFTWERYPFFSGTLLILGETLFLFIVLYSIFSVMLAHLGCKKGLISKTIYYSILVIALIFFAVVSVVAYKSLEIDYRDPYKLFETSAIDLGFVLAYILFPINISIAVYGVIRIKKLIGWLAILVNVLLYFILVYKTYLVFEVQFFIE